MRDSASRMFLLVLVLLGVWVVTFWLYEPTGARRVRVTSDADATPPPIVPAGRVTMDPPEARPAAIEPVRPAPAPSVPAEPPRMVTKVKPPEFRDYVVQRGDTGWMQIAARAEVYGDGRKWQVIARANPLVSPDRLKPGTTVLRIPLNPDIDAIQGTLVQVPETGPGTGGAQPAAGTPAGGGTGTPAAGAAASGERTHTVGPSDSLWSIARKYYGRGAQWRVIYEANRDVIKDPDRPPSGAVLRIPPEPKDEQ